VRLTVKTAPMVVAASLALMGVLVAPGSALARRAQGFHNTGPVVGGATLGTSRSVAVPFPRHPFVSRPFVRPFVRPFFPFAVIAVAPAVVYSPPPVYYAPPAYYAPPVYYAPPAYSAPPPVSYAPAPTYSSPGNGTVSVAPWPTPSVVEFSTGRYELRGDGVSAPYTWVWIPNPPTAPPPSTPPLEGPTSGRPSAPRMSQLYRWTDSVGVVHWTDRLDAVPEQYRSRAKQTTPS